MIPQGPRSYPKRVGHHNLCITGKKDWPEYKCEAAWQFNWHVFETVERHLSILAAFDEMAVGITHVATLFPAVIVPAAQ
jgi:hypothetical protein